eukprot:scaffold19935_cov203-Skeletonema_marinoi.AAC.4
MSEVRNADIQYVGKQRSTNDHSCRQARMLILIVIHVGKQEVLISSMSEARMLIAIHISEKGCYSHSYPYRKARIANGHSYREEAKDR